MAFPNANRKVLSIQKHKIMNLNRVLFTLCFMSITAIATAQEKGYYSIGNNAEKLQIQRDNKPVDGFFRAEKGYYAMDINRRKLRKSIKNNNAVKRRIPEIKKGYYSIGNNAARLREQ
jgi:hypothetical protein